MSDQPDVSNFPWFQDMTGVVYCPIERLKYAGWWLVVGGGGGNANPNPNPNPNPKVME